MSQTGLELTFPWARIPTLNAHLILSRFFRFVAALVCASSVQAATTNFFEGFESGLTNWVVGDGNPVNTPTYWGIVDGSFGGEGTHGGNFKAYCAANGFAGSASNPLHRDDMSSYLARTINLAGQTNGTLSFWYKMPSVEGGYDYARVFIGNTALWTSDEPRTAWTLVNLSLEPFLGSTQVLRFEFSSDGSVTNEGWYLDDITVTDGATPVPPPTNDLFSSSQPLVGSIGSVGASNRGATSEAGEPDAGNSIWFRWTPFTNGVVTFRTGGSAFDTVLCVYTGNTLASLSRVACDDNGDTNGGSLVSFNAVVGTTYRLSVRGAAGAAGFVLLSWQQPNGFGQDRLPDLLVWASDPNDYLYGWYLDQAEPSQPGRVLLRVSTATPNIGTGPLELHGSSTSPGVYQRVFRADGSSYDRFAGNFTFHPGHGHLHFDNWINLHLRTVLPNNGVGDIVASGDKTSFAIIDLIHYDSSLPGSPEFIQYGGGLVQGLSVGWADVYSANLPDQWIDVTDVPSGQYWLEGIVDPANSILESNETNNAARILINFVRPNTDAPVNDHFTNAIVLAGFTAGDAGSSLRASAEAGEPVHFNGSAPAHSLWWRWTAPSNFTFTLTTDGSSFDTVLAVYSGSALGTLTRLASDDDGGAGNNSRITLPATAGETYYFAVDGLSGERGDVQLHLNAAWNDAFASSIALTGGIGFTSGSTRGATRQAGEPNHAGVSGSGSIWYTWIAPFSGSVTFDTDGSSFDTLLGVYTGSAVNGLSLVASDNNSGSNGASRLTFNAVSNTAYRIAVDGVVTEGAVHLRWVGPAAPAILVQPLSTNVPAGSAAQFRVVASGTAPLAYQWRYQGNILTNGNYVSGAESDVLTLSKIQLPVSGGYSVVVSNAYGSVTSAPANLIVLDNPRVVFAPETFGHSGAFVRVPIEMQSLGDEHAVSFTLQFDSAILSQPRTTNVPAGATLTLDTNAVAGGLLGVTVTLAPGATFGTGHVSVVEFVFTTAPASTSLETFIGFPDGTVARAVRNTNDLSLPALFVPGTVELSPLRILSSGRSNGTFRLSFPAGDHHGHGAQYAVDASVDLLLWTPLGTNTATNGIFEFNDSTALPHRFYRVRILP
jgi:hypothetical protein